MAGHLNEEEEHRLRWVKVRQWQSTLEIPLRLLNGEAITVYTMLSMVVLVYFGIRVERSVETRTTQCAQAENGVCEDGLVGSVSSLCGAGADCVDCMSDAAGVRTTYEVLRSNYEARVRTGSILGNLTLATDGREHVNAFAPSPFPLSAVPASHCRHCLSVSRSKLALPPAHVDLATGTTGGGEAHVCFLFK